MRTCAGVCMCARVRVHVCVRCMCVCVCAYVHPLVCMRALIGTRFEAMSIASLLVMMYVLLVHLAVYWGSDKYKANWKDLHIKIMTSLVRVMFVCNEEHIPADSSV